MRFLSMMAAVLVLAAVAPTGQARAQSAERTQQIAEEQARKLAQQRAERNRAEEAAQGRVAMPYYTPGEDMYVNRTNVPPIGGQAVPPSERTYDLPSTTYRSLTETR